MSVRPRSIVGPNRRCRTTGIRATGVPSHRHPIGRARFPGDLPALRAATIARLSALETVHSEDRSVGAATARSNSSSVCDQSQQRSLLRNPPAGNDGGSGGTGRSAIVCSRASAHEMVRGHVRRERRVRKDVTVDRPPRWPRHGDGPDGHPGWSCARCRSTLPSRRRDGRGDGPYDEPPARRTRTGSNPRSQDGCGTSEGAGGGPAWGSFGAGCGSSSETATCAAPFTAITRGADTSPCDGSLCTESTRDRALVSALEQKACWLSRAAYVRSSWTRPNPKASSAASDFSKTARVSMRLAIHANAASPSVPNEKS